MWARNKSAIVAGVSICGSLARGRSAEPLAEPGYQLPPPPPPPPPPEKPPPLNPLALDDDG